MNDSGSVEATEARVPAPSRWRRRVVFGLIGVAVAYIGMCVVFYGLQESILFPGRSTQGRADAIVRESATTEIVRLTLSGGTPVVGRLDWARGIARERAPTVLVFYGNGQCAATTGGVIYLLQQIGCNVLTPDYPGYGMSGGRASEVAMDETADVFWAHLNQRTDIDRTQLHLVGWSLGGAMAIDLAARTEPVSLTTISAFTSATDMGRSMVPFFPVSWVLKHPFDSLGVIDRVKCPVLIIHGEDDTLIPAEMSRTLAARVKSPVTTLFIAGGDHNNIFDVDTTKVMNAIDRIVHAKR